MSLEDRRLLSSYLPLLQEFIPSAAEEIENDLQSYISETGNSSVPLKFAIVWPAVHCLAVKCSVYVDV